MAHGTCPESNGDIDRKLTAADRAGYAADVGAVTTGSRELPAVDETVPPVVTQLPRTHHLVVLGLARHDDERTLYDARLTLEAEK